MGPANNSAANDRPERAVEVFTEALTLSHPARAAYLDRICRGDLELKQKVEALLKAHEDAITRSLAKELGPRGIRVNAINPGMVETEGSRASGDLALAMRKQVEAPTPLGRIGQPGDIVGLAVFLASAEASWVTGETWVISGGNR